MTFSVEIASEKLDRSIPLDSRPLVDGLCVNNNKFTSRQWVVAPGGGVSVGARGHVGVRTSQRA